MRTLTTITTTAHSIALLVLILNNFVRIDLNIEFSKVLNKLLNM